MDIARIELLVNRVNAAAEVIDRLKRENGELTDQIAVLKQHNAKLKAELDQSNSEIKTLHTRLEKSIQFDIDIESKITDALTHLNNSITKGGTDREPFNNSFANKRIDEQITEERNPIVDRKEFEHKTEQIREHNEVNTINQSAVKKETEKDKVQKIKSNEISEEELRIKRFLSMSDDDHEAVNETNDNEDLFSRDGSNKSQEFINKKNESVEIEFGRNIPRIAIENEEFNESDKTKVNNSLLLDDEDEPDDIDFEIVDVESESDSEIPKGVL